LEDDSRNDNDDNTLGGVQHGGSDGSNGCCECKGEFIVDVEKESRQKDIHQKRLKTVSFNGLVPFDVQGRKFLYDNKGDGAAERDDVHDSVHVSGVHDLFGVGLKCLDNTGSELSLQCSGDFGFIQRSGVHIK